MGDTEITKIEVKIKRASAFKKLSNVEGENRQIHRKRSSGVKRGEMKAGSVLVWDDNKHFIEVGTQRWHPRWISKGRHLGCEQRSLAEEERREIGGAES